MIEQQAHDILLWHLGKDSWDTEPLVGAANDYLISIDRWFQVSMQVLFELTHQDLIQEKIAHECELGGFKGWTRQDTIDSLKDQYEV